MFVFVVYTLVVMNDINQGDTMSTATKTKTDMTVAHEIQRLIGGRAFFMMGAKHLGGGKNYLSWKLGRNEAKLTHVTVTLNAMDLYDIEFINCNARRKEIRKVVSTANGLYADMVHHAIEQGTKMYLSLGTMGS